MTNRHPTRLACHGQSAIIRHVRIPSWIGFVFVTLASRGVAIEPPQVAILYNRDVPESVQLAETYAAARDIPSDRLIGLSMPAQADITREDYEAKIRQPLIAHFDRMHWWRRGYDSEHGVTMPVENRIRAIALIRGTPLRISPTPKPENAPPPDPKNPLADRDEASVDSELAMFGVEGIPVAGVLQNRYFRSEHGFADANLPFMVLTARIDGPGLAVSKRMILDAVETEKSGLWGMAYADFSNKFPQGDDWLDGIVKSNRNAGIPTVTDRFDATLPDHYPMHDAALYYGWYDHHLSGPFLNPRFRLRRGAVAVHIHSFSAAQIQNPARNWVAPILAAGAAATLGNVYEPYLHLSHHLDVFHDRLLRGFTFVEAAWMAMPCTSWQGVAIGDPLYRPYAHFPDRGHIEERDVDFRALAMARKTWPADDKLRRQQLAQAVERTRSGTLAESLALEFIASNEPASAKPWLARAAELHPQHTDQIRTTFHHAAILRHAGNPAAALAILRKAAAAHRDHPEAKALDAWSHLLEPPPATNGQ
ncbi:MAG: TIGR03790 family protein [Luteolibacter sp.]|jgi:uncharacterized protein (TIGR03790 family)